MSILLALACAAIVYGSFYPWKPVNPGSEGWKLFWDPRHVPHEFILNIVLYVPVGFLFFAVTRSVPASIAAGFLLSACVEGVQPFFARDARALDLAGNTAGAAAGTIAAYIASGLGRDRWIAAQPSILAAIWALHQLYPFVYGSIYRYYSLSSFARISPGAFAEFFVDWLAAFALASWAVPGRTRVGFLCAAAILPVRTVLVGLRSTQIEWIAWAGAGVIAVSLGARLSRLRRYIGGTLFVILVVRELAPFHLAAAPAPFYFIPMEAVLSADWFFAVLIITQKTFVYGAIVFMLGSPRRMMAAAAGLAACLFALEWLQRYLPGRVPDITDPLLALFLGLTLKLLPPARTLETEERHCST